MTLCVAAECLVGKVSQLVIATDWETESEIAGAEIQTKLALMDDTHIAVFAGSMSRAAEFIGVCQKYFASTEGESHTTHDKLRHVVRHHKYALAEEHVSGRLGISYATFLRSGAAKLPPDIFREITFEISHITMGCSLIVAFVGDGHTELNRVNESGLVERVDNFAAIGSGMYIAEASLFQREHGRELGPALALFHVYEAMRLGAKAPGVGREFVISIFSSKEGSEKFTWESLAPKYYAHLESQFAKYGPKHLGSRLQLKREWIKKRRGYEMP